jgi:hypothetical protein
MGLQGPREEEIARGVNAGAEALEEPAVGEPHLQGSPEDRFPEPAFPVLHLAVRTCVPMYVALYVLYLLCLYVCLIECTYD